MRRLRKCRSPTARLALILTVALGGLPGCGPSFVPTVKTVYVPIFKSQTFRRDLNLQLNELLCKEIERRTPYKVVGTQEKADSIIEGVVAFDMENTVIEHPSDRRPPLDATINVQFSWMRNPRTEEDKKRGPTTITETIHFSLEIGASALPTIHEVNQQLATRIVDMLLRQGSPALAQEWRNGMGAPGGMM